MAKRKKARKKPVKKARKHSKKSSSKAKRSGVKVKLKKYPKRPKASASTTSMENYLAKVRAIDSENEKRIRLASNISKVLGKK